MAKFKGYKAAVNAINSYQRGFYFMKGIKRHNTARFESENYPYAHGSNGTYLMTDQVYTVTEIVLYVHEIHKVIRIDVRDEILEWSGRKRLTKTFLAKVQEAMPKNIWVAQVDGFWCLQKDTLAQLRQAVITAS